MNVDLSINFFKTIIRRLDVSRQQVPTLTARWHPMLKLTKNDPFSGWPCLSTLRDFDFGCGRQMETDDVGHRRNFLAGAQLTQSRRVFWINICRVSWRNGRINEEMCSLFSSGSSFVGREEKATSRPSWLSRLISCADWVSDYEILLIALCAHGVHSIYDDNWSNEHWWFTGG